jgi:hypothetical protein
MVAKAQTKVVNSLPSGAHAASNDVAFGQKQRSIAHTQSFSVKNTLLLLQ